MKAKKSISKRNANHNKRFLDLGAMLKNEGETKEYKEQKIEAKKEHKALMKEYKELGKGADKAHNVNRRNTSNLF